MSKPVIDTRPRPSMKWHMIEGQRGDDSYTEAMMIDCNVVVRTTVTCEAYNPHTCESYPSGVAVSSVVVEGMSVVHRWAVKDVEAHEDEETGEQVVAHERWSVEVKVAHCQWSRGEIVDSISDCNRRLLEPDADPDKIRERIRIALCRWIPVDQDLVHPVSHS